MIASAVLSMFDTKSFGALVSMSNSSGLSMARSMKSPAFRAARRAIFAIGCIGLSGSRVKAR